jgi:hypothetical protein
MSGRTSSGRKMITAPRIEPTFARFRRFRAKNRAFARLEQRQFAVTASKEQSKLLNRSCWLTAARR